MPMAVMIGRRRGFWPSIRHLWRAGGITGGALGLVILRPVLALFKGLDGVEYDWAAGYMIAVIVGAPLIIANFGLYALLSGAGNNRAFGVSLSVAFFLNIDPQLCVHAWLGWGIVGLALRLF